MKCNGMMRRYPWLRGLLTLAMLSACGGATEGDGSEAGIAPVAAVADAAVHPPAKAEVADPPDCTRVRLAAGSARPFEEVGVDGVAGWLGGEERSWLAMRTMGPDPEIGLAGLSVRDGEVVLVTPVHSAGAAGGALEIELADEEHSCGWHRLEVEPVEVVEGSFAAGLARSRQLLESMVYSLGGDPARLAGDLDDLPLILIPAARGWALLDLAEERSTGLTAELDFLATASALEDSMSRALDLDHLEAAALDREGLGPAELPTRLASRDSGAWQRFASLLSRGASPALLGIGSAPALGPLTQRAVKGEAPVAIGDAKTLARTMRLQRLYEFRAQGAVGALVGDVGKAAGPVGVFHPGAAGILNAVVFSAKHTAQAYGALLPCCFTELDFHVDRTELPEDYPHSTEWSKAEVWVENKGWNLTPLAWDAVFTGLSVKKGATSGRLETYVDRPDKKGFTDDFFADLNSRFSAYSKRRREKAAAAAAGDWDKLQIPKTEWGPIDITEKTYSHAEVVGGSAIKLSGRQSFEVAAVGTSDLKVWANGQVFGTTTFESKPITVEEISVRVQPATQRIEPGEQATLRAVVRHADDPRVRWQVTTATGRSPLFAEREIARGHHEIEVDTPKDENEYPILVKAVSSSRRGIRKSGEPERSGSGQLTAGVVVDLIPERACVAPGGEVQLYAEVVGANDQTVGWRTSGGSVNTDGLFRAPSRAGEYTVVATSRADPEASAETAVRVGGCHCRFTATLSGDFSGNYEGEIAFFSTYPDGTTFLVLMSEADMSAMTGESFVLRLATTPLPIPDGFVGGLDVAHVLMAGVGQDTQGEALKLGWAPGSPTPMNLVITQSGSDVLQGTLVGSVATNEVVSVETGRSPVASIVVDFWAASGMPACF